MRRKSIRAKRAYHRAFIAKSGPVLIRRPAEKSALLDYASEGRTTEGALFETLVVSKIES